MTLLFVSLTIFVMSFEPYVCLFRLSYFQSSGYVPVCLRPSLVSSNCFVSTRAQSVSVHFSVAVCLSLFACASFSVCLPRMFRVDGIHRCVILSPLFVFHKRRRLLRSNHHAVFLTLSYYNIKNSI